MPVYKSTKTTDGRAYYFSISYKENGKYKKYNSRKYLTKKEAELAEASYRMHTERLPSSITFDNVIEGYLADKSKELRSQWIKRVKVLCSYVSEQLGSVAVAKLTIRQYEQFRDWIDGHDWSISYKNKVNNQLKMLCKFAELKYDVSTNIPFKYPLFKDADALPQEMQFLTYEEFQRFISVVDDVRFQAFFMFLYYEGARLGEANALQWADIDLEAQKCRINKSVSTKMHGVGAKYLVTAPKNKSSIRTIPLTKSVCNALVSLRDEWSKHDGFSDAWYLFGGLNPIPETTIRKTKNRYCKLAAVKEIRIHDFRHSCASYWIHKGASAVIIAKLLGHSSTQQTYDTYIHMFPQDIEELMRDE